MTTTRGRYQRLRQLLHEGLKFLVVGGLGAIITIAGAVALNGLGEYLAVTMATISAALFTFLGNRYWTFRHRQGQGATQEGVLFIILNAIGLLIYYGCIWIIQDLMRLEGKIWYTVALFAGTGLGTMFRFWSYRKWVWTHRPQPQLARLEFASYAEPAMAGGQVARPIRLGAPAPTSRPPGRTAARHAAARRAPEGRTTIRPRPGAHRRP